MLVGLSCTLTSQPIPTTSTEPISAIEPPVAATEPPIAIPANSPLRLMPIFIQSSEPSGGWKYYTVNFALENQSSQWLPIAVDTGQGTVETEKGFNYDANPIRYSKMPPLLYGKPIAIPPSTAGRKSSSSLGPQWTARVRPLERLCHRPVEIVDKIEDACAQVF